MKSVADAAPRAASPRRGLAATRTAQRAKSAGPLAITMFLFIVIVVGRIGDIVPGLSGVPLVKIVVAASMLIALQYRMTLAPTAIWSLRPARFAFLLMLVVTLSVFFSVFRSATFGTITGTVLSVTVGLTLMVKAAKNWRAVRVMLFGYVASAIVLSISARLTSFAGREGKIRSLDPNDFAFVLVGLLPVVVTFAVASRGIKRILFFVISGMTVLTILLTQSRGGLLGLLTDVAVMVVILPASRRGHITLQPRPAMIVRRILILAIAGVFIWHLTSQTARTRLDTVTHLQSDGDGRITIWTQTLPLSLRRPWGWGAGAFPTVDGLFAGGRWKAPHNIFLQALIELGIPGFALLVATIVSSLRELVRQAWPEVPPADQDAFERSAFARGLTASVIGLSVSGFFLSELYSQAFWATIGLGCLVCHAPSASSPDRVNVRN